MTFKEENIMFPPEDLANLPQSSGAIKADIEQLSRSIDKDHLMFQSQLFLRTVGTHLLEGLSQKGIEDAKRIKADLESINPSESPLTADLGAVSLNYTGLQSETHDYGEQVELERLADLSRAMAMVATARAISISPKGGDGDPKLMLDSAMDEVRFSAYMDPETKVAVSQLVNEVRSQITA